MILCCDRTSLCTYAVEHNDSVCVICVASLPTSSLTSSTALPTTSFRQKTMSPANTLLSDPAHMACTFGAPKLKRCRVCCVYLSKVKCVLKRVTFERAALSRDSSISSCSVLSQLPMPSKSSNTSRQGRPFCKRCLRIVSQQPSVQRPPANKQKPKGFAGLLQLLQRQASSQKSLSHT